MSVLLDVAQAVSSTFDLTEILRKLARAVAHLLGADSGAAYLTDRDGPSLRPVAGWHIPAEILERARALPIPLNGHPFLEEARESALPVFSADPEADARIDHATLERFPFRSVLFCPMFLGNRFVGGLFALWWHQSHDCALREIRLVEVIGRQAALAVENARLFERTERQQRAAESLADVARQVAGTLDLAQAADRIVSGVLRLFAVRRATLYRRDPDSGALICVAVAGEADPANWIGQSIPAGSGLAGRALASGRPVWTSDVFREPGTALPAWLAKSLREQGYGAAVAAPLMAHGAGVGILVIGDTLGRVFTDEEISFLSAFAGQAALALRNAQLYEQTQAAREEALRESEGRYHALAEVSPVGILRTDAIGCYQYVNKCWCQITGLTREEAKGEGWARALHPDDRVRVATEWRRAVTENLQFRSEYRFRRRDGATTWVLGQASAERGQDGKVTGYVGTITDITDRHRAEEATKALVEVGRELAGTLDLAPVTDRIVSTVLRLFGVRHAALYELDAAKDTLTCVAVAGETEPSSWIGQTFPASAGVVGKTISEAGLIWSPDVLTDPRITLPAWAADNIRREDLRSVAAIPLIARGDSLGALVLADAVTRSFTEEELELLSAFADQAALALQNARLYQEVLRAYQDLVQARDELIQAQKMEAIGLLAGGIAHDFNNMLTVMGGRGEQVALALAPDDPLRRHVDAIRKVVGQAAALTQQLLAFSRKQVLQPKVLDLNAAVTELVPMLRRLIGEDIDLVFVPQPELGAVRADPTRLEQVILNLVVNARDAMPRGGRLTLETANVAANGALAYRHPGVHSGQYITLTVRDTGIGMDEKTRSRIFEPFFTTKGPGTGTGLGLSTVYGIIRQHGGHISVESTLGEGSTFTIYLPRVEGVPSPRQPERADSESLPGSETILLVEDEAEVRALAREALQSCGYTVLEARHGREGILSAEQHHGIIHLLVADVVMPQMSGPELAKRLARTRPRMRVLYLSGHTGDALARHGFSDSRHILEKPFTPLTLSRRVREILDEPGPRGDPGRRGDRAPRSGNADHGTKDAR